MPIYYINGVLVILNQTALYAAATAALEGGLYALALCPFGHITNAGLATNYDFVQPSFVTINARNLSQPSPAA